MTLADDIADIFAEVTPIVADALHASSYELYAGTRDGSGEVLADGEPVLVESGRCQLVAQQPGSGYQSGLTIMAATGYSAHLPKASVVSLDHTITIDERAFLIVDVVHPDPWGMFIQVSLESIT